MDAVESFREVYCYRCSAGWWLLLVKPLSYCSGERQECCDGGVHGFETMLFRVLWKIRKEREYESF